MALYIKVLNYQTIEWHVGEKINSSKLPQSKREWDCMVVQADGDELEYVLRTFKGIRSCDNRVIRWAGDDATFIVSNLM